ncbi:MAG: NTP transferase domain-containing protein [Rhodobacteraceae bacterium]|nr:NTP transferase domain-containing protein [Paracoccaceae bacterium]
MDTAAPVAIVLPAAGASARMRGRDKLLEPVDGIALLRRQALAALATGAHVLVTLPDPAGARGAALDGLALRRIAVPDAAEGMAASFRRAAAALPPGTPAAMVLLPDLPEITADDLRALLAARAAALPATPVLRATAADGTPGHPVIVPARLFPRLATLHGDTGARAILAGETVRAVALPGRRATTDLDTPEAWAAWRRARGEA